METPEANPFASPQTIATASVDTHVSAWKWVLTAVVAGIKSGFGVVMVACFLIAIVIAIATLILDNFPDYVTLLLMVLIGPFMWGFIGAVHGGAAGIFAGLVAVAVRRSPWKTTVQLASCLTITPLTFVVPLLVGTIAMGLAPTLSVSEPNVRRLLALLMLTICGLIVGWGISRKLRALSDSESEQTSAPSGDGEHD
ncbi:hypothetical protein [Blastopirellula marina]|uniref:Uncharacterized protein n=1 Tax=Blastopirellula marina TaxID=124 RepID=A0A2S8F3W7_9BACT|nr:hypothetical protein [Blastopirellula marina]PQO26866.1 hypothetical protein C5Y98_29280 [Blastopirellula marina]PQO41554.1 hypothetical protein C5Y93_31075 [Blastopirellula marina]PTL41073.1 hypothetical protein C5Y97_29295 [Blastopirellula marina]